MRKHLLRLILWLCERYSINIVDERRIPHGSDAIALGQRWEQFAREENGLYDMLEACDRDILDATQELRPGQTDELYAAALQRRAIRMLQGKVEQVIADGELAQKQAEAEERAKNYKPRLKSVNL